MARLRNRVFHGIGLATLAAASLHHRLRGYRKPTDFSASDWPRAIAHVVAIVEDWRHHLTEPGQGAFDFRGSDILELGPGATLGTGLLLIGLGARSYLAVDRFDLAGRTPGDFYRALSDAALPEHYDRAAIRTAADAHCQGLPGPVVAATDPDFDIVGAVGARRFDLVVSNAAFEHFSDVDRALAQVDAVARPGARLVAGVDFQTHTRGIRRHDPNSIYRFSPALYRKLSFPGQPNRLRPDHYVRTLEALDWTDIEVRPVDVAEADYLAWSEAGLAPDFRRPSSRMDILTGIIRARKR